MKRAQIQVYHKNPGRVGSNPAEKVGGPYRIISLFSRNFEIVP